MSPFVPFVNVEVGTAYTGCKNFNKHFPGTRFWDVYFNELGTIGRLALHNGWHLAFHLNHLRCVYIFV